MTSKPKPKQNRETPKKQESRTSENENKRNSNTDTSAVSEAKITTFFSWEKPKQANNLKITNKIKTLVVLMQNHRVGLKRGIRFLS